MNIRKLALFCFAGLMSASAWAERVLEVQSIQIDGKERRYYHLIDKGVAGTLPPILLLSGSGCKAFGERLPGFFERYPAPADVYFLEKTGIRKGDSGENCSDEYRQADFLERRVADNLEFIAKEPGLKSPGERTLAILGFSEGGMVAPLIALRSPKAGWLATVGSGGIAQGEEFLLFADRGVEPYATFTRAKYLQAYAEIKADPQATNKEFFGHSYRYWSSHLFYDPMTTYAKLDIPMIAAMGEKDDSVPIESGRALRDYFAMYPKRPFTFVEYPKASHALKAPDKNHLPDFIARLAIWFNNPRGSGPTFGQELSR